MRELYMLPMNHPIAQENIRRHISPAQIYDDLFDEEELDDIWKSAFDARNNVRRNRNGTVLMVGPDSGFDEIYERYKTKIDKMVGEEYATKTPSIGGNWFITPQQYGLHNDSIRPAVFEQTLKHIPLNHPQRQYTVWKNLIIPLWIGTHLDYEDGGQICFFDQRHIDWACVYNAGEKTENIASVYDICTDYTELQFYDKFGEAIPRENNNKKFNLACWEEYMNTPYERLQGLSAEHIWNWVPGTSMTFDAVQLHNTNEGSRHRRIKTWNSKMGLLLTFLIELDEDLLSEWRQFQSKLKDTDGLDSYN